jgi:hypothetical protein
MLPFLRGPSAWRAADGDLETTVGPQPAPLHSSDAQDAQAAQLSRRFARALSLRGHRPRGGRLADGAAAALQTTGRTRVARTRNCAANKREAQRRRRALLQLAMDGSLPPQPPAELQAEPLRLEAGVGAGRSMDEMQLLGAIRNLQADIAQLERATLLRDSAALSWRTNRAGAALDIANEYIMRLSGGYDPCNPLRVGPSASGRGFIERLLLPDVVCRDFQGVEAFLNQWEKYTIFHDDFMCRLSGMRVLKDSDSLMSVYIASDFLLTFTENTVKYLYPALHAEAERDTRTRGIVDQLVNTRVRLPMDVVLHFNEHGRVFAFESRSHLAAALLEVLDDPTAAMHVYRLACMTVDGHWKLSPDPDAQERQRRVPHTLL